MNEHHSPDRPGKDRNKPSIIVRAIATLFFLIMPALLAEGVFASYYFIRDGKWLSPRDRFAQQANTFIAQLTTSNSCRYVDSLYPHPYLAHVHKRNPLCPGITINNIGLFGRDFPFGKDPEIFRIMLTGGSVAAQLGQISNERPLFLEQELNSCYSPPEGKKRFEVLNGADGAWKQPQQAIMTLLYGDLFDAIISLDGYNERWAFQPYFGRLETPSNNFMTVNPMASESYRQVAAVWLFNSIFEWSSKTPLIRDTFTAFFLTDTARTYLSGVAGANSGTPNTFIQSIFALPHGWTADRQREFNTNQYRKYIRATAAVAKSNGAKVAFFLQPVPALNKRLTDAEKAVVGKLDYGELYRDTAEAVLELRKEEVPIFSLLDAFFGVPDTIYGDEIHFVSDESTGESLGNRLVAKAIAKRLAELWQFERTCQN
jgi:hypothetical protein